MERRLGAQAQTDFGAGSPLGRANASLNADWRDLGFVLAAMFGLSTDITTSAQMERIVEGIQDLRRLGDDERAYLRTLVTANGSGPIDRDDMVRSCIDVIDSLERPATFATVVGDTVADLIHEGRVVWPTQLLRSTAETEVGNGPQQTGLMVRLIPDAYHRECLFAYLEQAQERVLVASDRVTSKEDPLLHEKLLQKAASLAPRGALTLRFRAVEGDGAPLLVGLESAGATILEDGNNHAKAVIRDAIHALVTSFNLLSFGGRSMRRSSGFELGIELQSVSPASELFGTLFGAVGPRGTG